MADYNSALAVTNACTLLNTDGVNALCACCQTHGNSLHHVNKERRRRAKRTHTAGENCCSKHKNALTDCNGHRGRRRCC